MATGSYSSSTGIWYDRSGNNNHGIVSGSALTSSVKGWSFNGTNNYITFNPNLTAEPSSSYTLQWLTTDMAVARNSYIFTNNSILPLPAYGDWTLAADASGSRLNYSADPPFGTGQLTTGYTGSKTLFTFIATEGINPTLYTGSTYVGQFSSTPAIAFNSLTGSYYFGTGSLNSNYYKMYTGSVSSILVYNRVLSEAEINYNNIYLSSL